ncbi:hypothetical protein ACJRO7_011860 [Eucalyptus globulus]|uniref:Uncharacterized protein n=1 Tax=Eucalyptus globulus TaxID=34317 RepID=A0ABD3LGL7_EUCGL
MNSSNNALRAQLNKIRTHVEPRTERINTDQPPKGAKRTRHIKMLQSQHVLKNTTHDRLGKGNSNAAENQTMTSRKKIKKKIRRERKHREKSREIGTNLETLMSNSTCAEMLSFFSLLYTGRRMKRAGRKGLFMIF